MIDKFKQLLKKATQIVPSDEHKLMLEEAENVRGLKRVTITNLKSCEACAFKLDEKADIPLSKYFGKVHKTCDYLLIVCKEKKHYVFLVELKSHEKNFSRTKDIVPKFKNTACFFQFAQQLLAIEYGAKEIVFEKCSYLLCYLKIGKRNQQTPVVIANIVGDKRYKDIKVLELTKYRPRHFEIDVDVLLENSPNI
jgi:hypothetical protein